MLKPLTERYKNEISGVLSCFDRIVITGIRIADFGRAQAIGVQFPGKEGDATTGARAGQPPVYPYRKDLHQASYGQRLGQNLRQIWPGAAHRNHGTHGKSETCRKVSGGCALIFLVNTAPYKIHWFYSVLSVYSVIGCRFQVKWN